MRFSSMLLSLMVNGDAPSKLLRLSNGKFSWVRFPKGKEIVLSNGNVIHANVAQTSKYLYALFKVGDKNQLYRVGDTGDFSPVPLPGGNVGNVYALGDKPGLQGEIAFAAENNNGDNWIIELKPDGTEKQPRSKVKAAAGWVRPFICKFLGSNAQALVNRASRAKQELATNFLSPYYSAGLILKFGLFCRTGFGAQLKKGRHSSQELCPLFPNFLEHSSPATRE